MARIVILFLRASLLVTLGAMAAAQVPRDRPPAQAAGTAAVISGRVTVLNAKPLVPVRRARVRLEADVLREARFSDTDTRGEYRFAGLPQGAYRVTAEKPGFVTLAFGARRPFDSPAPIELREGQTVVANIALPRGAAFEGRISSEDGEPIDGIVVSATRYMFENGVQRQVSVMQSVTDDTGRYRVHSLPPGDYYLNAAPDPVRALQRPDPPGERRPGLVRTYFPGTTRVHEARKLTVAEGQDLIGQDFSLSTATMARITGRAVDSAGATPPNLAPRVQAVGGPVGEVRGSMSQDMKSFTYPQVPPGDYWVTAVMAGPGGFQEFAVSRVTVTGEDVRDIVLQGVRGTTIAGEVVVEPGSAGSLPSLRLDAIETEFELPRLDRSPTPAAIAVRADGRFDVPAIFGPRLFRVSGLARGWALKEVLLDGVDVTDSITDFRTAQAPRQLRLVITDRTAGVTGKTEAGDRVVVFPDEEAKWQPHSRFVKSVTADAKGGFSIEGLLPGPYLAIATDYLEPGAWTSAETLRALRTAATRIVLAAGEKAQLTLKTGRQP